LDVESAADLLLLADMHQATELKTACMDYIATNSTKVIASEGWAKLAKSKQCELVAELFVKLSIKTAK